MNQEALHILTLVVAEVGLWTWWDAQPPAIFQLEFNGAMLHLPGQQTGTGKIGLRFKGVRAAWMLTRSHEESPMPADWPSLLQREKLTPLPLDIETFSFDPEMALHLWRMAEEKTCLFGESFENLSPDFLSQGICLAFWAGNAGCFLAADALQVLHVQGEIALENLEALNDQWWAYWQQYWAQKDTPEPLPFDYFCEITLPFSD